MFNDLRPYKRVRIAGLKWLRTVPDHWQIVRAKSLMTAVDARSETGSEELLTVSSTRGVVPRSSATVSMFQAASYAGHKLCWPDDLVINSLWAWGRGLGVARHHGIVSTAYGVYRLRANADMNPAYLHQLVRSDPYQWELQVRSQGVWKSRLQMTDARWLDAPLVVPPLEEQAAIVKYLAHANARIDKAITAKRRLIALLKESRAATIDSLVLGRAQAKRATSSAPWLESVPAGWEWRRCRTLTSFVTSGSRGWAEFYSDTGPMFLQSGNLGRQLDLKLGTVQRLDLPASATEGLRTRVQPNDILVCITGALTGNVAIVPDDWDEEAYVNQHIALVRPRREAVDAAFLGYAMKSMPSQIQFHGSEYGGTKQGLGLDEVKNLEVLLPPATDQLAIVAEIKANISHIDITIARTEREVALLREFRTRLIADVVTGQVDVRKTAASLPEIDLESSSGADEVGADDDLAELDNVMETSED